MMNIRFQSFVSTLSLPIKPIRFGELSKAEQESVNQLAAALVRNPDRIKTFEEEVIPQENHSQRKKIMIEAVRLAKETRQALGYT